MQDIAIVAWFEHRTGLDVFDPGPFTIFASPETPYKQATPDRLIPAVDDPEMLDALGITDRHERGAMKHGPGVLEIKNVAGWMAPDWDDGPPVHYQFQVQHQLDVLGLDWAIVCAVFGGNDLKWWVVKRSPSAINAMKTVLDEFWDRVVDETEPAPILPDDLKVWERMHPGRESEPVLLPDNLIAVDDRLQEVLATIQTLEGERDYLQGRIKVGLGDNVRGVLGNGVSFSYKTVEVKERTQTVAAHSYRSLRRSQGQEQGVVR